MGFLPLGGPQAAGSPVALTGRWSQKVSILAFSTCLNRCALYLSVHVCFILWQKKKIIRIGRGIFSLIFT